MKNTNDFLGWQWCSKKERKLNKKQNTFFFYNIEGSFVFLDELL